MECMSRQNLTKRYWYDPESGVLYNRKGKLLQGHNVTVCDKTIEKPQLIWFMQTGVWVPEIDHQNRNHADNRWRNLREVTHSQNQMNRRTFKNNKAGIRGVSLHKRRWRARISINQKTHDLGYHEDMQMAHAVRLQAAWDIHGQYTPEFN